MTDKMEKQAMQKFFNYMKAYNYPPRSYGTSPSPYFPYPAPPQKDEKDKKGSQYPPNQMYGYPYPYAMPYPQGYGMNHQGENKSESDYKADMMRLYSSYYNYYYPYSGMYPPYYNYPREGAQGKSAESKVEPQLKILPKDKNIVKKEIVISSDQEQPPPSQKPVQVTVQPLPPVPTLPPKKFQHVEKEASEAKPVPEVIIEQDDPFYIRKKHKIFKETDKVEKQRVGLRLAKALFERQREKEKQKEKEKEKEKQKEKQKEKVRYQTMPQQTYKEMLKRQRTMGMEMFLARQMEKQQQLKDKQKQEREKQRKEMIDQREQKEKEKEQSLKKQEKKSTLIMPAANNGGEQKQAAKRQRIRDDHPLKQLRYNQSHGRIRLGVYFQSSIPNLLRNQQIAMRRAELQRRLRQRQVSAVTF